MNAAILALSGSLAALILAKVTVVLALSLIGTRLARRSRAAVRHLLLAAAFAVLLALPLASVIVPPVRIGVPIPASQSTEPLLVTVNVNAVSPPAPGDSAAAMAPTATASYEFTPRAALLTAWVVGATLFLLPVVVGCWEMRSLRRSGIAWPHGQAVVDLMAREANITRRVEVVLHRSMPGPMTCGVVHPVVVLPADAPAWAEEDRRRAIDHELEHIRRGDWVTQCLSRIVCACYWFHPLVWVAWRRLSLEAERACDDAVLQHTDATAYADQLIVIAERLTCATGSRLLAMANRHDLATRVAAVLDCRQRRGRARPHWVALSCAASMLLVTTIAPLRVVAAAHSPPLHAQSSAASPKFAVVSVKPCDPEAVAVPGGRGGGGSSSSSPGRLYIHCATVTTLVNISYVENGEMLRNDSGLIKFLHDESARIRGGPSWARSNRYTIEAKADGTPDRTVMRGSMLRAVLEDRFGLKIHREIERIPMYALTVAKSGLKLQPMEEGGCIPRDASKPPARVSDAIAAVRAGGKPPCATMSGNNGSNKTWDFGGVTLGGFASTLASIMDRHVLDQTGSADRFNIHLEYAPDESTPAMFAPRTGPIASASSDSIAEPSDPRGPSIFEALEKRLGLKLESVRGPREFIVIDHVERPTPNSGAAIVDFSSGRTGR